MQANQTGIGRRLLATAGVLTVVFSVGAGLGFWMGATSAQPGKVSETPTDDAEPEAHADHVDLTPEAVANLGLKLGPVPRRDFSRTILKPGEVVEIPGVSSFGIAAPVDAVVQELRVVPGQAVASGAVLATLRITDDELTDAQSRLLGVLTKQAVQQREVERLEPLVQAGAVNGQRKRELEYAGEQLDAERRVLLQELRARGMPEEALESLLERRALLTRLEIRMQPPGATPNTQAATGSTRTYVVETISMRPGHAVRRGDVLSSISDHEELYVRGAAFPDDTELLQRIAANDWRIGVETASHHDDAMASTEARAPLLRVDNAVDPKTQTLAFYLPLRNTIDQVIDDDGRQYPQWRFRPGQRIHLRLPVSIWRDQIVLPADAVAIDGPDAFVFVEHDGDHAHPAPRDATHETRTDGDGESILELERLPVRVFHRDDRWVVIEPNQHLTEAPQVALNQAFKLHLAVQMQVGGGHTHHHEH